MDVREGVPQEEKAGLLAAKPEYLRFYFRDRTHPHSDRLES